MSGHSQHRSPNFKSYTSSSKQASRILAGVKREDTRCEVVLRKSLWRMGLRYRKHVAGLPGKPDIVFTKGKVAVFCDGDFWHGRGWKSRKNKLREGSNSSYWIAKIQSNMERDKRNEAELRSSGWTVIRIWESDILRDPDSAATAIAGAISKLSSDRGGD